MTLLAVLNLISILLMVYICGWLAWKLSEAKYGLLTCIIQLIVHKNPHCFRWYFKHTYYVWYMILQITLICITLTQIGMFMDNSIFTRPLFLFIVYPIFYYSLYRILKYEHKVKEKYTYP